MVGKIDQLVKLFPGEQFSLYSHIEAANHLLLSCDCVRIGFTLGFWVFTEENQTLRVVLIHTYLFCYIIVCACFYLIDRL